MGGMASYHQVPDWKKRFADVGMVVFGMIMAVTPLALWVAPTKPWFYFVLKLFFVSSVMVWFLAAYETSAAEHQDKTNSAKKKPPRLPDRLIKEAQDLRIMDRSRRHMKHLQDYYKNQEKQKDD